MPEDDDVTFVSENKIREYIQFFLNHTQLADKIGYCTLCEDQWVDEIDRFKKTFTKEWNGEYKTECDTMFVFINEIMGNLVDRTCKILEEEGKVELGWSSEDNDFVYMLKKEKN